MSRDYSGYGKQKKRSTKPRGQTTRRKTSPAKKNNGGMFWFVSGVAVGGLATAMILVPSMRPDLPVNTAQESQVEEAQEPIWEFHDLLRQDEVVVQPEPVAEVNTRPVQQPTPQSRPVQSEATDSPVAAASGDIFLVQVGSFARRGDADTRRAQLMLINFTNATIEQIESSGKRYYRVIVGPYNDRRAMTAALNRISSKGIATLPLKRKK